VEQKLSKLIKVQSKAFEVKIILNFRSKAAKYVIVTRFDYTLSFTPYKKNLRSKSLKQGIMMMSSFKKISLKILNFPISKNSKLTSDFKSKLLNKSF